MSTEGIMTNGSVVAALFPSGGVSYGFQGGDETAHAGTLCDPPPAAVLA
jgi:hypothetical protein